MMAFGKSKFKPIRFDRKGLTLAQSNGFVSLINDAAKEFVKETAKHVPIYSGMAQGSLLPLANKVGYILYIQPLDPKAINRFRGDRIAEGRALGEYHLPSRGTKNQFSFRFTSHVPHYAENDTYNQDLVVDLLGKPIHNLRHPTPWNSTLLGMAAFTAYIDKHWRRYIPNPAKFITIGQNNSTQHYDVPF